jgi:hypothetical protein
MTIGNLIARLQKKGTAVAATISEKIKSKGGVGTIARNATTTVAEKIGYAVGDVKDAINMDVPGYKPVKDVYAAKGAEVGSKVVDATVRTTTTIADKANAALTEIKAEYQDHIFSDAERTVTIGNTVYQTKAETKTDLVYLKAYMQAASTLLPSRLTGREGLLNLIAQESLTSNIDLAKIIGTKEASIQEAAKYILTPQSAYAPIQNPKS